MATSPDGRPYGARWDFRTPSPDFARTAVEPLSPPPPIPSSFVKPPPSVYAINNYPPQSRSSYYDASPYPRNIRASSADTAPLYPYAFHHHHHNDAQPPPPQQQQQHLLHHHLPQHRENNRLDALAEIALMHGANRIAPAYSHPPTLPLPIASPVPVASAIAHSWQRHDIAQTPILLPRPQDVVDARPLHGGAGFGPIGRERRSLSIAHENGIPIPGAIISRRSPPLGPPLSLAEPDPMLSPPSMVERLPVASVLDSLRALAPKPDEEHARPWINPSPVDPYLSSADEEDRGAVPTQALANLESRPGKGRCLICEARREQTNRA